MARWAYTIPFFIYKKLTEKEGVSVWYRNSLAFDDFVFGYSDIDFTLFSEGNLDFDEGQRSLLRLKRLKTLFPHYGELALYDQKSLEIFFPLANPLELMRDPKLLKRLEASVDPLKISSCQKQVFALNWLRNDCHKWRSSFKSRERKIKRFFKLLEINSVSSPKNGEELLNCLFDHCWPQLSGNDEFVDLLAGLMILPLHTPDKEKALNDFYRQNTRLREALMTFFPQLWLGPALVHGTFDQDIQAYSNLTDFKKEIFKDQIKWEVWGLYGQWMREGGNLNFYIHLDALLDLLGKVGTSWGEIRRALLYMKDFDPSVKGDYSGQEVHYASR